MNANISRAAESRAGLSSALGNVPREVSRYLLASAVALGVDAGLYIGLIRIGGVHYLAAAPMAYAVGILVVYVLSTRWVFENRRLASSGSEFAIFTLVGIVSLFVNQLVIYACVENLAMSYESAKLSSATVVFGINFGGRKILLFTRF